MTPQASASSIRRNHWHEFSPESIGAISLDLMPEALCTMFLVSLLGVDCQNTIAIFGAL